MIPFGYDHIDLGARFIHFIFSGALGLSVFYLIWEISLSIGPNRSKSRSFFYSALSASGAALLMHWFLDAAVKIP